MSSAEALGGPEAYQARLAGALRRYREVAGAGPRPEAIDPARPEVQQVYRAFARAAFPIPFRPGLGEELALRLGLKPVLRLLTDPTGVDRLAAHFARDGFQMLASTTPRTESVVDGLLSTGAGAAGAPARVLVYAGRDRAQVEEAAALDEELTDRKGPKLARTDQRWRDRTRRLGTLLGYPTCCVEAFAALGAFTSNATPIAASAGRSARFEPRLDNLSLSVCHLTGWFPCRYDCPASLEVARAVEAALAARDPGGAAALRRYLAMPRLYADDRRQLLLDGELLAPDRIRLRTVHTPYAFDRDPAEAAHEWIFFADVAAPLRGGGLLTVTPEALVLEAPGRAPLVRPRPAGSTWLPFADP